jgi:hypothetical protein
MSELELETNKVLLDRKKILSDLVVTKATELDKTKEEVAMLS